MVQLLLSALGAEVFLLPVIMLLYLLDSGVPGMLWGRKNSWRVVEGSGLEVEVVPGA